MTDRVWEIEERVRKAGPWSVGLDSADVRYLLERLREAEEVARELVEEWGDIDSAVRCAQEYMEKHGSP